MVSGRQAAPDSLDRGRLPQAKVDPGGARREEATAADPLGDLAAAPRGKRQARAHGVAICAGSGALELESDEVAGRPFVMKICQGLPLGDDQQVEPAIVVAGA